MKLLATLLIILLTALYLFSSKIPTQMKPLPYIVDIHHYPEIDLAQNSDVLIIGDKFGNKLGQFIPELQMALSKTYVRTVKIYNWAKDKEGLHRTLAKVKSLKKVPPVIIYLGASQEFLEQKFYIEDYHRILRNFKNYNNIETMTSITQFPWLSKYYYFLPRFIKLKEFQETYQILGAKEQMRRNEIIIKLFNLEMNDLTTFLIKNNSEIIFLTTPLNLLQRPNQECKASTSSILENELDDIEKTWKDGKIKMALSKLHLITESTMANARARYLKGKYILNLSRSDLAINELIKANALDCLPKNGWGVFNSIIKNVAYESSQSFIDFNELLIPKIGHENLFNGEYPKDEYFLEIIKTLEEKIIPII